MKTMLSSLSVAGLACALSAPGLALSQEAYPAKPIHLVVPFPAGSGGDVQGRLLGTMLQKELGQTVVVENRPGAGGNIGAQYVARAAADGYTLLYGTNGTHAINKSLYGAATGFDPVKDFAAIAQFTKLPLIVVVRSDFPATTMPELLRLLKDNPGKYVYGSGGNGTTSHLAAEMLAAKAGIRMVHVPYNGNAASLKDLMGGQISLMIDVMPIPLPMVRNGRLRGLAVSSPVRSPQVPELPTLAESGVADFSVMAWDGLWAPAGTSVAIVDRLNAAVNRALATPEIRQTLNERAVEAAGGSPAEFRTHVEAELQAWGDAVRRSNARVD
ncbi:tripartite tricarboxylate transporter substrate binding protein [Pigmentiphaga sp. GD03639]|jgi:tripartite-type tricarboxylate transporter receptor subunit TctC|uniref:Tripartite tricarboxylate transporter substrate binding protein n=1 Tax=Pigmentiphaga daeguensis TaxID=414049 RepID=A0ABN1CGI6_9BURK|nr:MULTISPECIES: tripartite tricarboxylate transporter substrate binding protein [unclassified Pigmentiphaga]MDH2239333.1 tripartite tricarboxylate transporter substrate binding protein [Pigmentiphaga sp. GD03639]